MEKILITGVINGLLDNYEQFKENLKYFEGKRVDIIIRNHADKSTNPQKKYFFGVVFKTIANYLESFGQHYNHEDIYDYYKSRGYFGYTEMMGEPVPQGLSRCTTQQANEAKERIQSEWAEKGLIIPDPNQTDFLEN